jgi:hypothetical protein
VARIEETTNAYRILLGRVLGTRSLERLIREVKAILKWISRRQFVSIEDGRNWLRTVSTSGLWYYRG